MRVDLKLALSQLSDNERDLIYRLYFLGESESEIADKLGKTQQNINKSKLAILCKLHKLLK